MINNLMNFAPYNYRTTSDTTGCPSGFVGKFLFDARLVLKSRMQPVSSLDVRAMELTNGNLVNKTPLAA